MAYIDQITVTAYTITAPAYIKHIILMINMWEDNIKWILKKYGIMIRLDSIGLKWGPAAGFCGRSNEPWVT
jgi:hypothetical protein